LTSRWKPYREKAADIFGCLLSHTLSPYPWGCNQILFTISVSA